MNRVSVFMLLMLFSVGLGCTQKIPNAENKIKEKKESNKLIKDEMEKSSDKNKPKVSRAKSQLSKPAIEISRETSIIKNEKLHIVPNQFPFQDADKKQIKEDCENKKDRED